jgi:hypothetical protein
MAGFSVLESEMEDVSDVLEQCGVAARRVV